MAHHKSNFDKRLKAVEAAQNRDKRKVYIFNIYVDFAGPAAMEREFAKEKYRGCLLILNDIG